MPEPGITLSLDVAASSWLLPVVSICGVESAMNGTPRRIRQPLPADHRDGGHQAALATAVHHSMEEDLRDRGDWETHRIPTGSSTFSRK